MSKGSLYTYVCNCTHFKEENKETILNSLLNKVAEKLAPASEAQLDMAEPFSNASVRSIHQPEPTIPNGFVSVKL